MVKQVVFSWADRHLIVNWREAYKLWSVQVEAVLGLVTMAITILALTSDRLQEMLGLARYVGIYAIFSVAKIAMRIWKQKAGVKDTEDDE